LGRLATGSGIGSPYCVGHNVLSSLAHASFGDPYVGDTCDLSGVGSTLSHVDNSGVTATSNARLTSFPMLRIVVHYVVGRRNALSSPEAMLPKAPKPPVAPIAASCRTRSLSQTHVEGTQGSWQYWGSCHTSVGRNGTRSCTAKRHSSI